MRTKRPTRQDVANLAGVSPSTVSLVLGMKGDQLGISGATQQRIREAAHNLGYYPNRLMRSIMTGRTQIIGLYLRHDQWALPLGYWRTVIWHLEWALAARDLQMLVHNAGQNCSTEEAFARQAGGIVDGVLILNSAADPITARLAEIGMPAVEIGDQFSSLPFVGVDGTQGMRLVFEHLAAKGYRRPVYLGHVSVYRQNAELREKVFREAGAEIFGLDCRHRILRAFGHVPPIQDLMELDPKPDCVICMSDELAYQLLSYCFRNGIKVPDDLAISGFDCLDSLGCPMVMTSVETPLREMARLGVKKLLDILNDQPIERATMLPVGLRIGDTT